MKIRHASNTFSETVWVANPSQEVHEIDPKRPDLAENYPSERRRNHQNTKNTILLIDDRQKYATTTSDASHEGRARTGFYMSATNSLSSHLRNRLSVIRGFFRVSISPIRSCVRKSTS